jgi:hypothetical protein
MAHDDRARVAVSLVLAVVGAIAITKVGIDARDGVVRWLAFSLAAGLVINTPEGKPTVLLLTASAHAGLGLVVTLVCLVRIIRELPPHPHPGPLPPEGEGAMSRSLAPGGGEGRVRGSPRRDHRVHE